MRLTALKADRPMAGIQLAGRVGVSNGTESGAMTVA